MRHGYTPTQHRASLQEPFTHALHWGELRLHGYGRGHAAGVVPGARGYERCDTENSGTFVLSRLRCTGLSGLREGHIRASASSRTVPAGAAAPAWPGPVAPVSPGHVGAAQTLGSAPGLLSQTLWGAGGQQNVLQQALQAFLERKTRSLPSE